ncbi:hypothetical protein BT67DRAFT_442695 [Trichocladium antarcticum]|uniref:Suppressor protein SRP40 n=1 Tax=Trichocladium antarcticum TaxID=1450529 RepID=A0AAN6UL88_9PEZI|nr:hypothetical protein BT67DRAFT_442695 [Trichocladium antarcticum]
MTERTGAALPILQPTSDNAGYIRLHVTPLDAELLKVVVSSALLPKARNISYHTLPTFPEKRYGFLELPKEDADKLKKKLNGAVLRGVKIRIEPARPSTIPAPLAEAAMAKEKAPKRATDEVRPKKDKTKKRKRDAEVLAGAVLEDGRKIKRGWTTADEPPKDKRSKKDKEKKDKDKDKKGKDKEKRKQSKSKYTDHAECLVKTVLPANIAASADGPTKTKKGNSREVIIHEFEKTTKFPTFLKTAAPTSRSGAPPQFVDGQGWVDEDGNVVEAVIPRPPRPAKVLISKKIVSDDESTTNSDNDGSVGVGEPDSPAPADDSSPASKAAKSEASPPPSSHNSDHLRPTSSDSITSLSVKIPPATPSEPKVHPLEALYRRPQPADGEATEAASDAPGFSFFAGGNEESAEEDDGPDTGGAPKTQMPMTPFTRHDMELRGVRSTAPTPDTAHPNRRLMPWEHDDENGDQDDEDGADDDSEAEEQSSPNGVAAQGAEGDGKSSTDFQKWFWENRGDLNRSWKKRRKMAGKEKRYRENKARMAGAI